MNYSKCEVPTFKLTGPKLSGPKFPLWNICWALEEKTPRQAQWVPTPMGFFHAPNKLLCWMNSSDQNCQNSHGIRKNYNIESNRVEGMRLGNQPNKRHWIYTYLEYEGNWKLIVWAIAAWLGEVLCFAWRSHISDSISHNNHGYIEHICIVFIAEYIDCDNKVPKNVFLPVR